MRLPLPLILAAVLTSAAAPVVALDAAQQSLLQSYQAKAQGDAARGKALFLGQHTGGKPDTPSCTSCHGTDLKQPGKTKAGKAIDAMAASVAPKRYTDPAEVEKWFKRNCNDVFGRECSAQEKSDFLSYLTSL